MGDSVDITTVLLIFCAGIVFSILIITMVFILIKRSKDKSQTNSPSKHNELPSVLETGRSIPSMFTARSKKSGKGIGLKFKKKKKRNLSVSTGSNQPQFNLPGINSNAFTVTTTEGNEDIGKRDLKMDTQRLELEESYIKKDGEETKNYKLKLEMSSFNDESYTFEGDLSNLRSPGVGKMVMMKFKKDANGVELNTDDILKDI